MFEGTALPQGRKANYTQKKQTWIKQVLCAMFIRNGECGENAKNSHTFSGRKQKYSEIEIMPEIVIKFFRMSQG